MPLSMHTLVEHTLEHVLQAGGALLARDVKVLHGTLSKKGQARVGGGHRAVVARKVKICLAPNAAAAIL